MILRPWFVLLALAVPLAAQAQTALRCGSVLDPRTGKTRKNAVVVVQGDRIAEVRDGVPAGARVVDLSGSTCLPGLIDVHTHVVIQGALDEADYQKQLLRQSVPYRAIAATVSARHALEWGFTSIRDVGVETAAGYPDVDVKRAIEDGLVPGPRMQVATRAIGAAGAYPLRTFAPEIQQPQNLDAVNGPVEARKVVREQLARGADWIKVYVSKGTRLRPGGVVEDIAILTADELHAIVDEAHGQGKKVAAHAGAKNGVHAAVQAGIDTIEHGLFISDEDLKAMAAKGTFYVPTLYVEELVGKGRGGDWPQLIEVHRSTVRRALAAGVKVASGSDAGGFPWTTNPAVELEALVHAGLTPLQAVRAATVVNAELLGLSDQLGVLEAGRLADVIAVPTDPLQDVTALQHVQFVMKGGQIVRGLAVGGNLRFPSASEAR